MTAKKNIERNFNTALQNVRLAFMGYEDSGWM